MGAVVSRFVDSQPCNIPDSNQEPTDIRLHIDASVWSFGFFSATKWGKNSMYEFGFVYLISGFTSSPLKISFPF